MTVFSWLLKRERGIKHKSGEEESVHKSVYSSVEPYSSWNNSCDAPTEFGGVYNLEFSPDGSLLVAACEKRCVVLFDPMTNLQTRAIKNAHQDCVNCVKFLDDRMFATCSDDATIALWDTRNLKTKIRSLQGHMNWVKNIEYSRKDALLVTSGFDGSVFTWDINSYTEQGFIYNKVFHTSGLMRCRISPDANKLVISTTGGYLIIVHNLDLTTLAKDLAGFRPNIYRLMQMGSQYIPYAASFDHIFSKSMKKNRVELASDFPHKNDAEVISSLQIHPQGWCALSRNISYDESSEWTCVHDIQERESEEDSDEEDDAIEATSAAGQPNKRQKTTESTASNTWTSRRSETTATTVSTTTPTPTTTTATQRNRVTAASVVEPLSPASIGTVTHPDIWAAEMSLRDRTMGHRRRNSTGNFGNTHVYGISSGVMPPHPVVEATDAATAAFTTSPSQEQPSDTDGAGSPTDTMHNPPSVSAYADKVINQNRMRMLKYIEEPNKGKGYIKELCFSSDGRIICSPFGFGFRLLAFSDDCSELPRTLHPRGEAQPLVAIKYIKCHSDIVVSTKFSPRQPLFASGCLRGQVVWHQPKF